MNTLVCSQVWGYEWTETAALVYITEPHDREPNVLSHSALKMKKGYTEQLETLSVLECVT